jgi:hypothetical protein
MAPSGLRPSTVSLLYALMILAIPESAVRQLYSILAKLTVESIGTVLTVISIRYWRYEPAQQNMRRLFEGRWCFANPDHDRYYLKHHVANGARHDGRHPRFQQHPDRRITHHLMDDGMPLKEAV